MQHKHSPPGRRRLRNGLFLIALAVLFAVLAAVGCTAGPHFYSERGLMVFVPDDLPLLSPF